MTALEFSHLNSCHPSQTFLGSNPVSYCKDGALYYGPTSKSCLFQNSTVTSYFLILTTIIQLDCTIQSAILARNNLADSENYLPLKGGRFISI